MKKSLLILLLVTPFVLKLHAQDMNSMTPQQHVVASAAQSQSKQFECLNIQQYNPSSYLPQSQGGNLPSMFSRCLISENTYRL